MEHSDTITTESLPEKLTRKNNIMKPEPGSVSAATSLKAQLELTERQILRSCLNQTGWTLEGKRQAAKQLGISESTLYRRLKHLGLSENIEKTNLKNHNKS